MDISILDLNLPPLNEETTNDTNSIEDNKTPGHMNIFCVRIVQSNLILSLQKANLTGYVPGSIYAVLFL